MVFDAPLLVNIRNYNKTVSGKPIGFKHGDLFFSLGMFLVTVGSLLKFWFGIFMV